MSDDLAAVLESELTPIRCALERIVAELAQANRHASIRNALHVMWHRNEFNVSFPGVIDSANDARRHLADLP